MSAEPDEARTLERFGELCDRAAQYDLQVSLEFAVYTGVRTLAHAADVVARSKRANASVLIDALHFSRSGGLPAHVAHVDPALFRYAQICDAGPDMPGPTDTPNLVREARTGRLLPGEGVLPLKDLVAALPAGPAAGHRGAVPGHGHAVRPRPRQARPPGPHRPHGSLKRSSRGHVGTPCGVRISAVTRLPSSGPAARACETPCAGRPAAGSRSPRGYGARSARSGARCRAGPGRRHWRFC